MLRALDASALGFRSTPGVILTRERAVAQRRLDTLVTLDLLDFLYTTSDLAIATLPSPLACAIAVAT